MENEILWKWELLCEEFDSAKLNYINNFAPLFDGGFAELDGFDKNELDVRLKKAKIAWIDWVEIQNQIKKFVEDNT